jgi:hypothetical protein
MDFSKQALKNYLLRATSARLVIGKFLTPVFAQERNSRVCFMCYYIKYETLILTGGKT